MQYVVTYFDDRKPEIIDADDVRVQRSGGVVLTRWVVVGFEAREVVVRRFLATEVASVESV